MSMHELAGHPVPDSLLADIPDLISAYYTFRPDLAEPSHRVAFGTSGHRGCSLRHSFNERHILAISQAIAEYRQLQGIGGPLYLGRDTHALSAPAHRTALEVLAANEVEVRIASDNGYTPTPVISHAILTHNRDRAEMLPSRQFGDHPPVARVKPYLRRDNVDAHVRTRDHYRRSRLVTAGFDTQDVHTANGDSDPISVGVIASWRSVMIGRK